MNDLSRAIELISKFNTECENNNTKRVKLNEEHETLLNDYDNLHDDYTDLQTTAALSKINNKQLLKENADLKASIAAVEGVNELLSKQNEELQNDAGYKRKYEVASNDLRKAKDQVQRLKEKKSKPVKSNDGVWRKRYDESIEQIKQLLAYGKQSPQYCNTLQHSTQGRIDIIDLKPEMISCCEKGQEKEKKLLQIVIVKNSHHSIKAMLRVVGEDGLHTVNVPKGGTVQLDSEVRQHVADYFVSYDKHYGGEK